MYCAWVRASSGPSGDSSEPFGQNCRGSSPPCVGTLANAKKGDPGLPKGWAADGSHPAVASLWARLALPQELVAQGPSQTGPK